MNIRNPGPWAVVVLLAPVACSSGSAGSDAEAIPSRASCGGSPAVPLHVEPLRLKIDGTLDDAPITAAVVSVDGCSVAGTATTVQVRTDDEGQAIVDMMSTGTAGIVVWPKVEGAGLLPTRYPKLYAPPAVAWWMPPVLDAGWSKLLPAHPESDAVALVRIGEPLSSEACHTIDKGTVTIDEAPGAKATYYGDAAPLAATTATATNKSGLVALTGIPKGRFNVTARWAGGCTLTSVAQFEPGSITFVPLTR